MKKQAIDRAFSSWEKFLDSWKAIAKETVARMDENRVVCFVNLANDCVDIMGAVLDNYKQDELTRKVTFLHFQGVFKEIAWLNLLFLGSNYPLAQARLRFIWELIFHAYLVDTVH